MPTQRVWKREYTLAVSAKRRAQRWKRLGIIAEGETIFEGSTARTVTVVRDGQTLELLSGEDVRRALKLGMTRITDWQKNGDVPPSISLDHARCFTLHQANLLKKLGAINACCANQQQLAQRAELIKEIWGEWWA